MLTDKEYLLLCEFTTLDISNSNIGDSIGKMAESLLTSGKYSNNAMIEEVAANSNLTCLTLKCIRVLEKIQVSILEDECNSICAVFIEKEHSGSMVNEQSCSDIVDLIQQHKGNEKCVVTGLELGGLYASYVASKLGVEGVLFCVPGTEAEMTGNIINYVPENNPVGVFPDKIVFVKQKTQDEDITKPYSQALMFDENGKVVVGEQTEYSKFVSWFYNTAGSISNDIWKIFFKDTGEDEVLIEKDMYAIFLKVDELCIESITNSLKSVVKYIGNELEKNLKTISVEYDKLIDDIESIDYEEGICGIAQNISHNAVEIVNKAYSSVETILMGLGLFTAGKSSFDTDALMEQFSADVDWILEKETERILDTLENERQRHLDALCYFPEMTFE